MSSFGGESTVEGAEEDEKRRVDRRGERGLFRDRRDDAAGTSATINAR
jgi:hypothetical protein